MARISDIVANARATVGHIIRYISGGAVNEMPNRQYLDFAGNCTVSDDGTGIRVTVPDVPAGSVTVGNVVTLPAGSMAYVNNTGTPVHAILDFGIPRGDPSADIQPIQFGGTGADTAEGARENLSVPSIADLQAVSAIADNSVQLTGDQVVEGIKTFRTSPIVPTATAGDDSTNAASTAYVDAAAGVVSAAVTAVDNSAVHKTGDETIAGTKTFSSSPVVPSPSANDDSTIAATTEWVRDATFVATGSTTGRTLENRFADVINVRDFGAKGDGVTDDTAAIQAALNEVKTSKKTLFFSEGLYICSASLTVSMSDDNRLAITADGATLKLVCDTAIQMFFNITPSTVNNDVEINGLKIDGNTKTNIGLNISHSDTNSPSILLNNIGVYNIRKTNVDWECDGVFIEGEYTNVRILNPTIKNIVMAENTGDPGVTGAFGISVIRTADTNGYSSDNTYIENPYIENIYCEDSTYNGKRVCVCILTAFVF